MLDQLSSGSIAALVIDEEFVRHTVSHNCEFVTVATPFSLADHGYGYNARLSTNLTQDMNRCAAGALYPKCIVGWQGQGCCSLCTCHLIAWGRLLVSSSTVDWVLVATVCWQ